MAAITVNTRRVTGQTKAGGTLVRYYGTGTSNQADTLTSTAVASGKRQKLSYVTCMYSGSPTQAGVAISIDSQLGAGYDTTLTTGSANAQATVYLPSADLWLDEGDAVVVAAPAGGSVTAAIVICMEEF
jgi:hypothetical protein